MQIAQAILQDPKMSNHNRGLWGYTGTTAGGQKVTVQSSGIGGPSAAVVVAELIELGVKRIVRVGTCGSISHSLGLGELVVASEAICADGASRALGAGGLVRADPGIVKSLSESAPAVHVGSVVTTDLFYEPDSQRNRNWSDQGAVAVEMETATVFTLAQRHSIQAGCLLAVTDLLVDGKRKRLGDSEIKALGPTLGLKALEAL